MNISDFLNMGGYALYVWGSYAIATLIIGGLLVRGRWRLRKARENCKTS